MKNAVLYLLVGAVMLGGLSSCRSRVRVRAPSQVVVAGPRVQAPPQPSASAGIRVSVGGVGITAVTQACNPNAPEACNGLDDNCNGVIDEGCGFSGGNIQITLAWATGADLDLYVTDPSGYTISYSRRRSPSGGHLDQDARGACVQSRGAATIETVYAAGLLHQHAAARQLPGRGPQLQRMPGLGPHAGHPLHRGRGAGHRRLQRRAAAR